VLKLVSYVQQEAQLRSEGSTNCWICWIGLNRRWWM